jgi:hypothetical protein
VHSRPARQGRRGPAVREAALHAVWPR